MTTRKTVLWITRTAVLTALLIVTQAVTAPLGNTIVTGSAVNLILIVSVMTCGLPTGITVALISPFLAKLFGIGPFWEIVPVIMIANAVLVCIWFVIGNIHAMKRYVSWVSALAAAAVCKFLVLYLGVVKLVIPLFMNLPEQQAEKVSALFSVPQLITATVGGVLAILVLPVLKRVVKE